MKRHPKSWIQNFWGMDTSFQCYGGAFFGHKQQLKGIQQDAEL